MLQASSSTQQCLVLVRIVKQQYKPCISPLLFVEFPQIETIYLQAKPTYFYCSVTPAVLQKKRISWFLRAIIKRIKNFSYLEKFNSFLSQQMRPWLPFSITSLSTKYLWFCFNDKELFWYLSIFWEIRIVPINCLMKLFTFSRKFRKYHYLLVQGKNESCRCITVLEKRLKFVLNVCVLCHQTLQPKNGDREWPTKSRMHKRLLTATDYVVLLPMLYQIT